MSPGIPENPQEWVLKPLATCEVLELSISWGKVLGYNLEGLGRRSPGDFRGSRDFERAIGVLWNKIISVLGSRGRPWGVLTGGEFGKAAQGGEVYTEHLGGARSFLGALGEGDFDEDLEGSRPWEEKGKYWGRVQFKC